MIEDLELCIKELCHGITPNKHDATFADDRYQHLATHFEAYLNELRTSIGPLVSVWMSYIDFVDILKMHLSAIHSMIP